MIKYSKTQYWLHCSGCNAPFPRARGCIYTKFCDKCLAKSLQGAILKRKRRLAPEHIRRARKKATLKAYNSRPEVKAKMKVYAQRPEVKARRRFLYQRDRRMRYEQH